MPSPVVKETAEPAIRSLAGRPTPNDGSNEIDGADLTLPESEQSGQTASDVLSEPSHRTFVRDQRQLQTGPREDVTDPSQA